MVCAPAEPTIENSEAPPLEGYAAHGLHHHAGMLPNRKSAPAPRAHIAAEVRVPSEGTWFAALAASVRSDGLFLSTFRELPAGTAVVVELSLPDGPAIVDGVVEDHEGDGQGVRVAFDSLPEDLRTRIEAASYGSPPISGVTSRVA